MDHVKEIIAEAERLGFTAHENSWKQLRAIIDAALRSRNSELVEGLGDLVKKLELVHDDPGYRGVWQLHHIHGGRYNGPTYEKELARAKSLLTPDPATERKEP